MCVLHPETQFASNTVYVIDEVLAIGHAHGGGRGVQPFLFALDHESRGPVELPLRDREGLYLAIRVQHELLCALAHYLANHL